MNHRILIVDDHPLYREGMLAALQAQMEGVEALAAGSGEEGLEVLARDAAIDLALIDIRLPGMDGFSALGTYARRFPSVACMLLSGADDPDLAQRAMDAGASGFIYKSMSVAEVCAAIRHVLGGGVFARQQGSDGAAAEAGVSLTLRQLEVLGLLGEGRANRDIAQALEITERTAKAHVAAILDALGVENRTQAALAAQRMGVVPLRRGTA